MTTMQKTLGVLRRMLDAAQRRFRSARPGSVLIMVITLLVLLALIGTAAITTTQIDRASASQHVKNIQIDLLIDGVKTLVVGEIVRGVSYAGNSYDSVATDPDDSAGILRQVFLSSRLPEILMLNPNDVANGPSSGLYAWRYVGSPPIQNGAPYAYASPIENSSNVLNYAYPLPKLAMVPLSVTVRGQAMPALRMYDVANNRWYLPPGGVAPTFLAADADGDGIADAILWKLPISPISGVTYYGAARIIDNNSAVNPNTAGDPTQEFPASGAPTNFSLAGVFPSSVNIMDLLSDTRNIEQKQYSGQKNLGDYKATSSTPSLIPLREDGTGAGFQFSTPGDAWWHQLGRRLDNPGLNTAGNYYGFRTRPFGVTDHMAIAKRFTLANGASYDSTIELAMDWSCGLATSGPVQITPYLPGNVSGWFNQNFAYPINKQGAAGYLKNTRPARALLAPLNPTRNRVVHKTGTWQNANGISDQQIARWGSKANLNTATFEELWQCFYDVMAEGSMTSPFDDDQGWVDTVNDTYKGQKFDPVAPFASTPQDHPSRVFRSPVRAKDPGGAVGKLHPVQVMILRSAIAAANTMALRDPNDVPFSKVITIPAIQLDNRTPAQANAPGARAVVYGLKRQPFITEVYLNNDPNKEPVDPTKPPADPPVEPKFNPSGLVVVELHNPYDVAISLANYRLMTVDRDAFPSMTPSQIAGDDNFRAASIPPNGFLLLTNFKAEATKDDPDSAQKLPAYFTGVDMAKAIHVARLHEMIGKELLIVRDVGGAPMPVDSYDATGMPKLTRKVDDEPKGPCEGRYYCRSNQPASKRAWHFVYPGRYQVIDAATPRHQGTHRENWDPTQQGQAGQPNPEPWLATKPMEFHFGAYDPQNSRDGDPNMSSFPIQICNSGSPGPFRGGNHFPFGAFARVGDALQVPYIGSYALKVSPDMSIPTLDGQYTELNAVTMDSVAAEDTDVYDDRDPLATGANKDMPLEDIGRFAAWDAVYKHAAGTLANNVSGTVVTIPERYERDNTWVGYDLTVINNHATTPGDWKRQTRRVTASTSAGKITLDQGFSPSDVNSGDSYRLEYVRYSWATDLFDFFTTIASPADDFLPQADAAVFGSARELTKNVADPLRQPNRQANPTEDDVPVEGLININTANWRVLATLPLVVNTDGTVNKVASEVLARAIVYYRDIDDGTATAPQKHPHGPFRNVMELLAVPGFQSAMNTIPWDMDSAHDATLGQGDWTPMNDTGASSAHDFVRCDFEEKFLTLTRISNLVTTRSDSFTVYIMVQGWRDAGGANAELVAQRRGAFIVDRSGVYVNTTAAAGATTSKAVKVYNVPIE